jgi:hypothetical protein
MAAFAFSRTKHRNIEAQIRPDINKRPANNNQIATVSQAPP